MAYKTKQQNTEYMRSYRELHPGKNAETLKKSYHSSPRKRIQHILYMRNRRLSWISALGGQCAMCGDTDERHLEIDHINEDGHKEKVNGRRRSVYERPPSEADPTRYQVLCANCHAEKTWEYWRVKLD